MVMRERIFWQKILCYLDMMISWTFFPCQLWKFRIKLWALCSEFWLVMWFWLMRIKITGSDCYLHERYAIWQTAIFSCCISLIVLLASSPGFIMVDLSNLRFKNISIVCKKLVNVWNWRQWNLILVDHHWWIGWVWKWIEASVIAL